MDKQLTHLSAKFKDPRTEAAYQSFIADGDRANNRRVLTIALPIFPLYVLLDYFTLANPEGAIAIRLTASVVCALLLFGFSSRVNARHHEVITLTIVLILGLTINAISAFFATLDDAYFVGLIQGCVFTCFPAADIVS